MSVVFKINQLFYIVVIFKGNFNGQRIFTKHVSELHPFN